jgi:multiple sugar transport system ATP-binding protein
LSRVRSGDSATLWLDAERLHLFDPQSGDNLTRRASTEQEPADRPPAANGPESHGRHAANAG